MNAEHMQRIGMAKLGAALAQPSIEQEQADQVRRTQGATAQAWTKEDTRNYNLKWVKSYGIAEKTFCSLLERLKDWRYRDNKDLDEAAHLAIDLLADPDELLKFHRWLCTNEDLLEHFWTTIVKDWRDYEHSDEIADSLNRV